MNRLAAMTWMLLGALAITMAAPAGAADHFDQAAYERDIEFLTQFPHRLSGYGAYTQERIDLLAQTVSTDPATDATVRHNADADQVDALLDVYTGPEYIVPDVAGSLAASVYVQQRLEALAEEHNLSSDDFEVFAQEFEVVQPVTTECRLTLDGQEITDPDGAPVLYAVRPNSLQASITPAEGLEGPVIYAGQGDLAAYGNAVIEDSIVLLDPDADWLTPFAFGAKAVVFLGRPVPGLNHTYEPANLPRFYIPEEQAEQLDLLNGEHTMRIQAACEWQLMRGRNVIAVLRGTNPRFVRGGAGLGSREAILLSAKLDSFSEVPLLSPGARDAANCAGLLQVAEAYMPEAQRPSRDVIFAFFDGVYQANVGPRSFYGAIYRPENENDTRANTAGESYQERFDLIDEQLDFYAYALRIYGQDRITRPDVTHQQMARNELLAERGSDFFLNLGTNFTTKPFFIFTVLVTALALVLMFVARAAQPKVDLSDPETPRGFAVLFLGSKVLLAIAGLLVVLFLYGLFLDPHIMGHARGEFAERNAQLNARLDDLEEEIAGLTDNHRAAINMLKEIAKERDSLVLVRLRDLRINIQDAEVQIEADRAALAELEAQRDALATQAAGENASEDTLARHAALVDRIDAAQAALTALEDQLAVDIAEKRDLIVDDMLYNNMLRIIQQDLDPTDMEVAERLSLVITDPDEAAQAEMRASFIAQLRGDPENGVPGMMDRLIADVSQVCRDRRTELLRSRADLQRAKTLWNAMGPNSNQIVLHICMDIGDAHTRWSLLHGDTTAPPSGSDLAGQYDKTVFAAVRAADEELGEEVSHFDARPMASENINQMNIFSGPSIDSSGVARMFGVYNLAARTIMDSNIRQGQPFDTLDHLDLDTLTVQLRETIPFIRSVASAGPERLIPASMGVTAVYHEVGWEDRKNVGPQVVQTSAASAMASHPVAGAVVAQYSDSWIGNPDAATIAGYVSLPFFYTDQLGFYTVGPLPTSGYTYRPRVAAVFDRPTLVASSDGEGETELQPSRGLIRYVSNEETIWSHANAVTTVFQTRSMTFVNYGLPRLSKTLVMRAISTSAFQTKESLIFEPGGGRTLVVFAPYNAGGLKLFNATGMVVLNNDDTPRGYEGVGIPLASIDDEFTHLVTPRWTAIDLGNLNWSRLNLLRDNEINEDSLWANTSRAHDMLEDTLATEGQVPMAETAANYIFSAAMERRTYPPLKAVMNDLVSAVVFLLLLAMPFAYAMERLIIGTPHIYRQLSGFAIFFLATFLLLYLVNPAFKIASQPIIIFLAFTIILLSTMVIIILIRKLQSEVKRIQGLGATVHSTDVSRISTLGAAVMMGISTMRRRPLRTILTAVTIVLLTFTMLTFASFGSEYGNRKTYKGPLSSMPPRIILRDPLWSTMSPTLTDTLQGRLSQNDAGVVVPRIWVSPTPTQTRDAASSGQSLHKPLTAMDLDPLISIAAAIGMDIRDTQYQPALADLFSDNARLDLLESNGIFLTEAVAAQLNLTDADIGQTSLYYNLQPVVFAGYLQRQAGSHLMLEGSNIIPVDYQSSGGGEGFSNMAAGATGEDGAVAEMPEAEGSQFTPYSIDEVVVIGAQLAATPEMGGELRSLTVYPTNEADVEAIANDIATATQMPTYFGSSEGVFRLNFTKLTQASGLKDLLIPVVLGGLIIFATMLGSVTDREREIYTFSSLGLAPPHVASLFFAEASVYAVIGGMGGYLLGQTVARSLGWLTSAGILSIPLPDMNYSSFNAAMTILIVMGTVLISTIYPAIKASRSANPGIQRSWKTPPPENGLYDLIFPFTVSAYDIAGVVSFLKEHFDNYTDTSLGIFATTRATLFRDAETDQIGIMADMALAPFDLGVNQRFALLSQPSEIPGIDEVRILILRQTGTNGDWRRANRVFINDLRKQFLIWRSLTTDVMDNYRAKTLEAWDSLPVLKMNENTIGELS